MTSNLAIGPVNLFLSQYACLYMAGSGTHTPTWIGMACIAQGLALLSVKAFYHVRNQYTFGQGHAEAVEMSGPLDA